MKINEIFFSIQGEGTKAGTPMVFIRLSGCNLRCHFCDTKYAFEDGNMLTELEIMAEINKYRSPWVCVTGGEPFMQGLSRLIDLIKASGRQVQIETNGTIFAPIVCDHLVVSPKKEVNPDPAMLERADEIKVVVDSPGSFKYAKRFENPKKYLSIQPVDNDRKLTKLCVDFVKSNPKWHLSLQLHKLIDMP